MLLVLLATHVSTASAKIVFDSDSGFGYVSKNDIENSLGRKNIISSSGVDPLYFEYKAEVIYDVTEEWHTLSDGAENRYVNIQHVTVSRKVKVSSFVLFEPNGVTKGYTLTGYESWSYSGEVPYVGQVVVNRDSEREGGTWYKGVLYPTDKVIVDVSLVSVNNESLYVNYGGSSGLLWSK